MVEQFLDAITSLELGYESKLVRIYSKTLNVYILNIGTLNVGILNTH